MKTKIIIVEDELIIARHLKNILVNLTMNLEKVQKIKLKLTFIKKG